MGGGPCQSGMSRAPPVYPSLVQNPDLPFPVAFARLFRGRAFTSLVLKNDCSPLPRASATITCDIFAHRAQNGRAPSCSEGSLLRWSESIRRFAEPLLHAPP